MAEVIQDLIFNPPFAVARLGSGSVPQDSFRWITPPDPRSGGETVVSPDWSLTVEADATVTPNKPTSLNFRDGAMIRPVAPFFEVWALVGEPDSAPATWREVPLTPERLDAERIPLRSITFRVTAMNGKAARRTGDPALRFGTFPPVEITADDHVAKPLLATSPPDANPKMIPAGRNIPLGSVQVLRSRAQPAPGSTPSWADTVDVAVMRLRFTPARGHFYGPPETAWPHPTTRQGSSFAPVDATRAFLDPAAGWAGVNAQSSAPDEPSDTYDGASVGLTRSLGVVDDTCEVRIEVGLSLPSNGRTATAAASIFVAPPDFAPDRRPFLSLADEINDRAGDAAARSAAMTAPERDVWVENLFERIYETASLLNVDGWRLARAATLPDNQLAEPIPDDKTPEPALAAGGEDALRNRMFALPAPSDDDPLPLTRHARMRHQDLANLQALIGFIRENESKEKGAGERRLRALIRPPFQIIKPNENAVRTTMAMPPFMRQSNAYPLTLSVWQYDLLMDWASKIAAGAGAVQEAAATEPAAAAALRPAARPLSERAQRRRDQVLARVRDRGQ